MEETVTVVEHKPNPWEGSGKFIQRLLLTTELTPDQIVELVLKNFQGRKTTTADVYWNRGQLVKAGKLQPLAKGSNGEGVQRAPSRIDIEIARREITRGEEELGECLLYLTGLPPLDQPVTISSQFIARFIAARRKLDRVWHKNDQGGLKLPKRIKRLWAVCSSASFLKSPWNEFTMSLWAAADEVIFCTNDYKGPAHAYFVGRLKPTARYVSLTTVERSLLKQPGELVDWNVLAYRPQWPQNPRENKVLYYGTVRPSRVPQFEKLFPGLGDKLVISSTKPREQRWFKALCPQAEVISKVADPVELLSKYTTTVIMEDPFSYRNYTAPPNRFYEAISAGTGILFASGCGINYDKRWDISPYKIDTAEDILAKLDQSGDIAAKQGAWKHDYIGALEVQFNQILNKLEDRTLGRDGVPIGRKSYVDEIYKGLWG